MGLTHRVDQAEYRVPTKAQGGDHEFKNWTASFALVGALAITSAAAAVKQYGPGVTDTEIKIGNTMPYSGPASAYGTIGKSEAAYFDMINDQGGINGRKVNFISRDDGYSPRNRRNGAEAGRGGSSASDVRHTRHAAQHCDLGLPE